MRVLNQRKLLTSALLALGLMATNQAAYADQPAALTWKILEAAKEGTALAGYTQGGDSRLLVQLSPWDLKQRTPLLVVFRSCGGDPIAVDKPMLNFEAYMAGKDTSPIYDPDWKAPEPRWRLCPENDAVLVYPNSTAPQQVLLNVDFLRLANEGMSPRIDMAVYNLSSEELKIWPTAEELARNHRNQPPDAIVPLTLHYRLTRNKWVMGSYASIFGAPSRDLFKGGKSTGDYEKLAKTLPVNLESFRRKIYIPDNTDYDRLESIKQALEISRCSKIS